MLKIWQKFLYRPHYLSFREIFFLEDGFKFFKEGVDFFHIVTGCLFNNAKGLETIHVCLLTGNIKFLIGFLASGVGTKVHDRVLWK